ncbi:MAG TPA: NAD(P)/FAD-dependent oxidoreductase [Gemmatimonadales bacterium]|nr:NAD(P)/FAD-dependent oxidoreductase [Gemmatimonadales bacterium]
MTTARHTATIVGSGPNGLAAAITLAAAGVDVTVFEAETTIGGGTRSGALTLPGFTHDVCSAIHPMGIASPFFRSVPLERHGLEWIQPPAPLAHPFDDGHAIMLTKSLDSTCHALGADVERYRSLFAPLVRDCDALLDVILAPLIPPRHPIVAARFGIHALRSAQSLATSRFRDPRTQALFAGIAAHSLLPLDAVGSASFALVLGMIGHRWGWPFPRGGSQQIANALAGHLRTLGGSIVTGHRIGSAADLPPASVTLFDTSPRQLVAIAGDRLPARYRRRLERFRYGPAAFKIDWALSGPIPWRAAACAKAATVHLGGTLAEIAESEQMVSAGAVSEFPYVLLTQPSLFDDSRAPAGQHTAWAYCHVPNGSTIDMTERIEQQIERFAPGFRDVILARHVLTPAQLEEHNANYIGGDVVGGANDLLQLIGRPVLSLHPYAVPVKGWFLCSASTPPGGGVHGMAGHHAAHAALRSIGMAP